MNVISTKHHDIFIGKDSLSQMDTFLQENKEKYSGYLIFGDSHTLLKCLPDIVMASDLLEGAEILEIEPGEESKSAEILNELWTSLVDSNYDRNYLLINLGGGVVSDLGGFMGATYKRGIDFINVPTTLLSMIDASFGGKTAVNIGHVKNQVGVFAFPKAVFVYPNFLRTLEKREIFSGFAEALKHGLIADADLFDQLSKLDIAKDKISNDLFSQIIKVKSDIVEADCYEKAERKLLNFGHTIGHAIESFLLKGNVDVRHGEAVALGIISESYISLKMNMITNVDYDKIVAVMVKNFSYFTHRRIDTNKVVELLIHDKKNSNGTVNFVLLNKIGGASYNCLVDEKLVFDSIFHLNEFWDGFAC